MKTAQKIENSELSEQNKTKRLLSTVAVVSGLTFCLIIYYRLLSGFRMLTHDTAFYNYPWREFVSDAIRSGVFVFWDSFSNPGFPVTFLQGPVYYPIAMLMGWIRLYDEYSFIMEIIFTHVIAFVGMYIWLRITGVDKMFAVIGAISFSGCGPLVTSRQSYPIQATMMFLPWFFLGIHLLICDSRYRLQMWLLGIVSVTLSAWMMLTGGYIAVFIPVVVFGAIYAFLWIWYSPFKMLEAGLGGLISIVLVVMILFLPLSEYWVLVRPHMDILRSMTHVGLHFDPYNGAFPPASVFSLVMANGSYLPAVLAGRAEQMYMGLLLSMALLAPLVGISLTKREKINIFVAVLVILASMGSWNPVARFFVMYVPFFSMFRHHVFWDIITIFLLISTTVSIIPRLITVSQDPNGFRTIKHFIKYMWVSVIIMIVLAGFTQKYSVRQLSMTHYDFIEFCISYLIVFGASILWFILVKRRNDQISLIRMSIYFMAGLFVLMVLLIVGGHQVQIPAAWVVSLLHLMGLQYDGFSSTISPHLSSLVPLLDQKISYIQKWVMMGMDVIHVTWILIALSFVFWNFRKGVAWISVSLLILVFLDLGFASQRYMHGNTYWIGSPVVSKDRNICYSNNIRERGKYGIPPFQLRKPYIYTYSVFYDPALISLASHSENGNILSKLLWFFPGKEVPKNLSEWQSRSNDAALLSVKLCPNQMKATVVSGSKGWLVWTDSVASGWFARIDNTKKDVTKIFDMKAIEVPEGHHDVEFYYKPPYLHIGVVSFIVGLFSLMGIFIYALITLFGKQKIRTKDYISPT